jgi:hypothetical protein
MNIISASSPRCLLFSPAKIQFSLSSAQVRVEQTPPSAAFDLDFDLDLDLDFDLDLDLPDAPPQDAHPPKPLSS